MSANDRQHGGNHYKRGTILQHWDVCAIWQVDYFTAASTKYLLRWRDKNGLEDVEKSVHYTEKRGELVNLGVMIPCGVVPNEVIKILGRQHGLKDDEICILTEVFHQGSTALSLLRNYLDSERRAAMHTAIEAEKHAPGTPEDGGHHARDAGGALAEPEVPAATVEAGVEWPSAVRILDMGGCVRRVVWPLGVYLKSEGLGNWVRMSASGMVTNRWSPDSLDRAATDWVKC